MTDAAPTPEPYGHLRPLALKYMQPAGAEVGTVWFRSCPVCGSVRCTGSAAVPEDKLVIDVKPDDDVSKCDTCQYVIRRFPELYEWVTNVVANQAAQQMGKMILPMLAQAREDFSGADAGCAGLASA